MASGMTLYNTCLVVLVMAGIAAEPSAPQQPDSGDEAKTEFPRFLPADTPTEHGPASSAPPAKGIAPKPSPTSVLLPPISSSSNSDKGPSLFSRALPSTQPSIKREPAPSLLEPPPDLHSLPQSASEFTLEIVVGQPHLLTFSDVPQRIALAVNEKDPLASLQEVPHRGREWYLLGKKPGTTFLDVWLPDPASAAAHRVQHYCVRIVAERENNRRQSPDSVYETLAQEINRTFPGSNVHLKRVGDTLVVFGSARNVFEATRILTLARGFVDRKDKDGTSRSTIDAGGSRVINLLRIPGEQQIMLHVVVAEVSRPAARSLGLDFGFDDKRATVLPNRPAGADGSSTLIGNGWIGQALRTLQDFHYAQVLAEPTLTTLNGQAARFQAGGEFPVPVVSPTPGGAVQGVHFRSYGIRLSVQPVVADTDRIRVTVDAEVSGTDPSAAAQVAGTAVPGLKVRNFQSTVELREGETLAVAGLLGYRLSAIGYPPEPMADSRQPIAEQELVVLISPLLLHSEAKERGVGRADPLNPQSIELYLRSRDTLLPRADALYLIGPQGYAGAASQETPRR